MCDERNVIVFCVAKCFAAHLSSLLLTASEEIN